MPQYLNLFVEKKIADQLAEGVRDNEMKLENVYRLLKDQLKRAKADLLNLRRSKDETKARAYAIRERVKQAVEKA